MKKRFWLWRRHGIYYLQDAETREKESLHTRDRQEAERLRNARNDATARPALGMALAKAYFRYRPNMEFIFGTFKRLLSLKLGCCHIEP
jgi:hypothetical protein